MRTPIIIILTIFFGAFSAGAEVTLDSLNKVLSKRDNYLASKKRIINNAEARLSLASNATEQLKALNDLYKEYHTFRFDSAMVKVEQMRNMAQEAHRNDYVALANIHESELLTTSGLFHEALKCLESVDRATLPNEFLTDYFKAYEWTYSMLAEYAAESKYSDGYYSKEMAYQDSIITTLAKDTPIYNYWMGEKLYRLCNFKEAKQFYEKALSAVPVDNRLFAQVTFGLALCSTELEDKADRRKYLILAAISDQVCPLKENLALQTLALDLASEDKSNLEQANRYLRYSLEDAMFYGNRLRLMEISQKIPDIVENYELGLETSNRTKSNMLVVCIVATSLLLAASVFGFIERRKLNRSRRKLDASYQKLSEANALLQDSHGKLSDTNNALKEQKKLREDCIKLFIDLTAAYIYKLNMFQMTVQRKIKARQTEDLIRYTNPSRMNEAEAREFFNSFDHTFLKAFPNFIQRVNELLMPEHQIKLPDGELNLDLRILALIRLGIRDSSKIATLLNLSPQTIYNHRSNIKARVIDRENFEKMVGEIV